ncbi:hypothetical protein BBK36DRAFT_1124502 [Trichoderma citrinoviride]|uniref:Uncharacterized protein n=1 Tax=Trichoderma citrinoviride TaxID=58853 RepID=A0A2T4B497_9HYPO|nr:hypothetical protein BBK36DRAFT_1124502 [Trichoderma citrinoviride]PTB64144.1 hypothetical protein BBK36DRAFT_1124502 [Trichoderma citrinoviride]
MSTSNDDTISISSSQGEQSSGFSIPLPTSSTSASSSDKENKPPRGQASRPSDALPQLARPLLPSFDVAHRGWDASNVPTAKCDLCHKQRCGTLQKCRVCKLSICHGCCLGDRLKNDRRHSIDVAVVDWDVQPSLRKRRFRAIESKPEPPKGTKRQKIIIKRRVPGRGPSGEPSAASEARGSAAPPGVMLDGASSTPDSEVVYRAEAGQSQYRNYGRAGSMASAPEPRLSVATEAYHPSAGRAQQQDTMPPIYDARYLPETKNLNQARLPAVRQSYGDDGHGQYGTSSDEDPFYAAPATRLQSQYPVPHTDGYSQAAASSRPVLPSIASLLSGRLPSFPPQATSERYSRSHQRFHNHEDQPVASEAWPLNEYVGSLGTGLANAARANHASFGKPLDQCLRDELQAVWASPDFIGEDRDAGFRYRRLLSAAYYANACLGLSPRGNAAREWLCEEERKLWDMGYESIKSVPLMDFLHEVGVRYLR